MKDKLKGGLFSKQDLKDKLKGGLFKKGRKLKTEVWNSQLNDAEEAGRVWRGTAVSTRQDGANHDDIYLWVSLLGLLAVMGRFYFTSTSGFS
jgi:hypothetical protein